jgi:hypothetical protein
MESAPAVNAARLRNVCCAACVLLLVLLSLPAPVGVQLWCKDAWLQLRRPVYRPRIASILSNNLHTAAARAETTGTVSGRTLLHPLHSQAAHKGWHGQGAA